MHTRELYYNSTLNFGKKCFFNWHNAHTGYTAGVLTLSEINSAVPKQFLNNTFLRTYKFIDFFMKLLNQFIFFIFDLLTHGSPKNSAE